MLFPEILTALRVVLVIQLQLNWSIWL